MRYQIPAEQARVEIKISNSRFIGTAAPVFSVDEAKAFIQQVKQEFSDASHNVPAFLIGHGNSVTAHCTDDGEPSGTAGRPVLMVVQGSGLGDVVVVITRYFGGTKLGTGGLVKAYGDTAKAVLEALPRAERVPTHDVLIGLPYTHVDRVKLLIEAHHGEMVDQDFGADVLFTVRFAQAGFVNFELALSEMSHGSLSADILSSADNTIMPLTNN